MRAVLLLASTLLGCGSNSAIGDTGLEIVVHYDAEAVRELSLSGEAAHTFGPYVVSSSTLPPGGIVSIRLDRSDAGQASVCAQARNAGGYVLQVGCGTYDVRAGEIEHGTLDLAGTSAGP
jgi:hypothetical protein